MSMITHHNSVEDLLSLLKIRTRVHTLVIVETDGNILACTAKSVKARNLFKRLFMGVAGIYNSKIKLEELTEDILEVKNILQIV